MHYSVVLLNLGYATEPYKVARIGNSKPSFITYTASFRHRFGGGGTCINQLIESPSACFYLPEGDGDE